MRKHHAFFPRPKLLYKPFFPLAASHHITLQKPLLRYTASVRLTMSSAEPEHEHREEEEAAGADDEDTGAQVAPIVRLEEVAVTTGEENEDAILDL